MNNIQKTLSGLIGEEVTVYLNDEYTIVSSGTLRIYRKTPDVIFSIMRQIPNAKSENKEVDELFNTEYFLDKQVAEITATNNSTHIILNLG